MKRFVCVGLLLASLGCDRKPEVREVTKPLDQKLNETAFPLLDPPAKSEPASLEIVSKIVAAHTLNNPATLAKIKGIMINREGSLSMKDAPVTGVPLKYTWQATWPHQARFTWQGVTAIPLTFRVIEKKVWMEGNQPNQVPPLAENRYEDILRENYSTWLQTPLPLVDPDSIITAGPDFQSATQNLKGVRIWRKGMAQAIVYYDPKTFLISRVAYDGRDTGIPIFHELSFYDHKEIAGFVIAQRLYVRRNGSEFMEFTKVDLAIAQDHPTKLFAEP